MKEYLKIGAVAIVAILVFNAIVGSVAMLKSAVQSIPGNSTVGN